MDLAIVEINMHVFDGIVLAEDLGHSARAEIADHAIHLGGDQGLGRGSGLDWGMMIGDRVGDDQSE